MHRSYRSFVGLSLLVTLSSFTSTPSQAQITEYTSRNNFEAGRNDLVTFTFDGYAPAHGLTMYPNGLTVHGVTFTAPRGVVVLDAKTDPGDPYNGHQYLTDGSAPDGVTVSALPSGTTAFGLDLDGFNGRGTINIIADGQPFFVNVGNGLGGDPPTFVGFTSNTPFTSLSFMQNEKTGGFGVDLNNITFGPAFSVPEASSGITFGLLLALITGSIIVRLRQNQKIHERRLNSD